MTEINRLENELKNFHKGSDYLVSNGGRGEKIYTVRSEGLKQSLRDIIHSRASEEWQIGHAFGQDGIEYVMEKDDKFAVYRKSLDDGSPDGLVVLNTNQPQDSSSPVWQRREKFLQSVRGIERSRKIVEESRQRNKFRQQRRSNESNFGSENYVAYSAGRNERGQRVIRKEERYSDPVQEQATKEGEGYNFANELVSILSKEPGNVFSRPQTGRVENESQSNDNNQSTQDNDNAENFTHNHQIPPKK